MPTSAQIDLRGRFGALALMAFVAGCGPVVASDSDTDVHQQDTENATSATTLVPPVASTSGATSTSASGLGDASTAAGMTGDERLDLPEPTSDSCSTWTQDCPDGTRCVLWSNDGGPHPNDTRCEPISQNPAGPGEPCSVGRGAAAETDNCDIGMMCSFVDPDSGEGLCTPFCIGSPDRSACIDPTLECLQYPDGIVNLCVQRCDALVQDCPPTLACHLNGFSFMCVPDRSMGGGGYGEPCQGFGSCAPGNTCLSFRKFDDCAGVCCSPWCDVTATNTCPGPDQLCVPFNTGSRDPALENLGVCANEH